MSRYFVRENSKGFGFAGLLGDDGGGFDGSQDQPDSGGGGYDAPPILDWSALDSQGQAADPNPVFDYTSAIDAGMNDQSPFTGSDYAASVGEFDPTAAADLAANYDAAIAAGYSMDEAAQIADAIAYQPNVTPYDYSGSASTPTGGGGTRGGPGSGGGGGGGISMGGSKPSASTGTPQPPAATAAQIAAEFLKLQKQGVDVARVAAQTSQKTAANVATTRALLNQTAHPTSNWFSESTLVSSVPNGALVLGGLAAAVLVLVLMAPSSGKAA